MVTSVPHHNMRLIYERENMNVDAVSICHTETMYYYYRLGIYELARAFDKVPTIFHQTV